MAALVFVLLGLIVRAPYIRHKPLLHPFVLAAVWSCFEWFQANSGWSGVPWGRLPLGQAKLLPLLQSASLVGSYFVTFLIVAVNGLLAYLVLYASARRVAAVTAAGMLMGNLGVGVACLLADRDEGEPITVAVIQGNLSSDEKWGSDISYKQQVYGSLTEDAAEAGADVVVWPETAFPYDMDRYPILQDFLTELAVEQDVTLLASVFTEKNGRANVLYNSVVAINPNGRMDNTRYHKRSLVPFGEFVPWRDLILILIPPLANVGMLEEDLAAGQSANVFDDLAVGKIGSAICFDSIYENNMRESVLAGAELLAVSTNDSWFYDSRGIYMHQYQAKLRAIETGRYLVRAGNTGISCVISDKGVIEKEIDPLVSGYIVSGVNTSDCRTLYSYIGNSFVYLLTVLAIAPFAIELVVFLKRKRG